MNDNYSNKMSLLKEKFADLRARRKSVIRDFKKKLEMAKIEEIKNSFK